MYHDRIYTIPLDFLCATAHRLGMSEQERVPVTAEVSREMRDEIDAAARRILSSRATVIRLALRAYLEWERRKQVQQ